MSPALPTPHAGIDNHPLHIHVNPFQISALQKRGATDPYFQVMMGCIHPPKASMPSADRIIMYGRTASIDEHQLSCSLAGRGLA